MDKIRKYVEELFEEVPNNKRNKELSEELIYDLNDKYSDLIAKGIKEDEAYQTVISGIGDIQQLFDISSGTINSAKERKTSALVVSISVGFYFLSLIALIVLSEIGLPDYISASTFFGIAGIATCILIYYFASRPKYIKKDDNLVENFKEWKITTDKNKEIRNAVSGILWLFTTIIYFIISFMFSLWYISWVIFIIAAMIEVIIDLIFKITGN